MLVQRSIEPKTAGAFGLSPAITQRLLEIFRGDAENAVKTIRKSIIAGDINSFITSVHGIKSALASIGAHEISELAASLERAGLEGDMQFITANAEHFSASLEALAGGFNSPGIAADGILETDEVNEHLTGKTFLIVDDSAFARMLLKSIIIKHGYRVIGEAENGKIGVKKFIELKPDFVTTDVVMDDGCNLTLLEQIIRHNADAKVIVVSSMMNQKAFADKAREKGAKALLTKPVNEIKLVEAIKSIEKNFAHAL